MAILRVRVIVLLLCVSLHQVSFRLIQVYCPHRLNELLLFVSMAATVEGLLLEIIGK